MGFLSETGIPIVRIVLQIASLRKRKEKEKKEREKKEEKIYLKEMK